MPAYKCAICGKSLGSQVKDNPKFVPYKGRYTHVECFNIMLKAKDKVKKEELSEKAEKRKTKAKKKTVLDTLKDGMTEEEFKEKQRYFDTIRRITGIQELDAATYKVADDYIAKYKFTFTSMRKTLEYYFEVLGNEPDGMKIFGIIPYKHDEALEYYSNVAEAAETNKQIISEAGDLNHLYRKKKIQLKPQISVVKQIDISEIGGDSD